MNKREKLEIRRKRLVRKIIKHDPWIKGSVVEIKRICGSKGCACRHNGPKHPAMYITWKEDRKTRALYVPRRLEAEVKLWIRNYRKLKVTMEKITKLQKEIIALR